MNSLTNIDMLLAGLAFGVVVFAITKAASSIAKLVVTVSVLGLLGYYVLQPAMFRSEVSAQVARLSPEASVAVQSFTECTKSSFAASPKYDECKQQVLQAIQAEHGAAYAAKAQEAVTALVAKLKQASQ